MLLFLCFVDSEVVLNLIYISRVSSEQACRNEPSNLLRHRTELRQLFEIDEKLLRHCSVDILVRYDLMRYETLQLIFLLNIVQKSFYTRHSYVKEPLGHLHPVGLLATQRAFVSRAKTKYRRPQTTKFLRNTTKYNNAYPIIAAKQKMIISNRSTPVLVTFSTTKLIMAYTCITIQTWLPTLFL